MGCSPGEKSGLGEVVDFQGLPPPISRMVHASKWGEKSKGGRRQAWRNKELVTKVNHKKEVCMRWEQGEVTREDYRDAAQTNVHEFKKDGIYYW